MNEEFEVLKIVSGRLDAAGIPYMVTGSMALNYYAVPRMTRDVDLVAELSVTDAGRFCDAFCDDFYLERETVRESIERRAAFNVIHTTLVVKVDVVVRKDSEYRRTEFARRRRVTREAHPFLIVAPEDLLISKLDRARDTRAEAQMKDARTLVLAMPELDRSYPRAVDRVAWNRGALSRGLALTDTPPAMEARYREMLLARSGEERLKMAGSMYATARALVIASILEKDPSATPPRLREALFLRFYGHEFDAASRERILARLARGTGGGGQE